MYGKINFLTATLTTFILAALPMAAGAQTWTNPSKPQPPAQAPASAGDDIMVTGRLASEVKVLPGPKVFVSPMGEPFRSTDDLSGAEHWFRQADSNDDGSLTLAEFKADAMRFFATLDTDKDGDIGPTELEHYEDDIAPEVKITSTYGDMTKATVDSDGKLKEPPYPERLGAGRYGYLALPEPISYADTNFDRGVSRLEFTQAAEKRFKLLDRNGDDTITRAELPKPGGR